MNQKKKTQNRTDQSAKVNTIEKWTLYLQITTLLLGVIVSILGYICIERFKAQESKANTKLIESNTKLVSFGLIQLVTELRPNFKLEIEKWNLNKDSLALQLLYQITNEGKYSILVKKEINNIYFTKSNERLEDRKNQNFLLPGEDFTFVHHVVSSLGPNEKLKGEIIFYFNSPLELPIDLTLSFIVELDPTIVMMMQNNAKDLLWGQDVLNQLKTQITHTECFTLINQ